MRIIGSSGNSCTPWPGCTCRVCTRARDGGKDQRYGNHLYLPEIGLLTDASEHVFAQLNRFSIRDVRRIVITHWHPDHTAGLRIIQALSGTFLNPNANELTIYLTRDVHHEIITKISPALTYYLENANATIEFLEDGQPVVLEDWTMTPITFPEHPQGPHTITAFLFEHEKERILFAPDETKYLPLERTELNDLDILIKEIGYFTHDPEGNRILTEETIRNIPNEIRFDESIEQIRRIGAKRVILTEIEEAYKRTHEDYEALAATYPDLNLEIAYDGKEL